MNIPEGYNEITVFRLLDSLYVKTFGEDYFLKSSVQRWTASRPRLYQFCEDEGFIKMSLPKQYKAFKRVELTLKGLYKLFCMKKSGMK